MQATACILKAGYRLDPGDFESPLKPTEVKKIGDNQNFELCLVAVSAKGKLLESNV
jgi:hypothetical protein